MRTFVFVGILGGFTTFSTFMLDTFTLAHGGDHTTGIVERRPADRPGPRGDLGWIPSRLVDGRFLTDGWLDGPSRGLGRPGPARRARRRADRLRGGRRLGELHAPADARSRAWRSGAASPTGSPAGRRALLVAEDAQGLCGTVQLVFDLPENQPHRGDLAKMLVHRRVRRQGLGAALMRAAEATARECGKTLLVLDAVTSGDAARLYERLGWTRVGDIPGYALMPAAAGSAAPRSITGISAPAEAAVNRESRRWR